MDGGKKRLNRTLNEFGPSNSQEAADISQLQHNRQMSTHDLNNANQTNHQFNLPKIAKDKNRVRFLNHSADGNERPNKSSEIGQMPDEEADDEEQEPKM